jgi:hypothetical protein
MDCNMNIRILEQDNNKRGDLFGRLMADLFVALGYDQPRLNIHKSGREIDLSAEHRLERRHAIAECKATADTIGGTDLNKFVGALDAEHERDKPITGYFISLSGFKETAIEQEKKRRNTRIILLTGSDVIEELIKGRILVAKEHATEIAGRLCAGQDSLALDDQVELLAHQRGWMWAIYWTQGKQRTHFALIHADGTPLARVLADEIIAADQSCNGALYGLTCLNPMPTGTYNAEQMAKAVSAYARYLSDECGFILLDGLPADSDVGSRPMRLENLFVPLHLDIANQEKIRQPVGSVLEQHPQLALLAAPGGGKSTLIKRLAVAYADPARRDQAADGLPQRDWLPLFFRCRELRGLARNSFADLIEALSEREHVRQHSVAFRAAVDAALAEGRILLLVDGLDEIADSGDRAAFVCTLRSALQAYPGTAFVVTSREAGFRHVAAHLAPICTHATLSSFNADDIRRLSVAWHREVVGDTEKVRTDAEQLAVDIVANDRIERLAVNPLLLTTLLLVKRWVGSLPTRRAVLYGKAVEVLLMTWNTEGHDAIPQEEALPQLCYVAATMMLKKIERISRPRLAELIRQAREALPTELGYVQGSVEDFIHRVEDRSSLLMMTGHDVEDGLLVEFFEFRHLTFQEFLAARAIVEGWHPERDDSDTLADVLETHFNDDKWREVIPLAAVLGGKATEALIVRLTEEVASLDADAGHANHTVLALANCLADEAAASPATIRAALRELVRFGDDLHRMPFSPSLAKGKYGIDLREEARLALLAATSDINNPLHALSLAVYHQILPLPDAEGYAHAAWQCMEMLESQELIVRCEGALCLSRLSSDLWVNEAGAESCRESLARAGALLEKMLFEVSAVELLVATYALSGIGANRIWASARPYTLAAQLASLWRRHPDNTVRRLACRVLVMQAVAPRGDLHSDELLSDSEFDSLWASYGQLNHEKEQPAALLIAYYGRAAHDAEISSRAQQLLKERHTNTQIPDRTLRELLGQLGTPLEA